MMTTMRPIMRPCSGTSLPAADDPPGVPVSVSPQVGAFIVARCGVHDDGTGSIGVHEPQMNRNTELRLLDSRSSCSRTTARDTDGRIIGPSWPDLNPTILADHQTDGSGRSRTRGRVNAQLRPFIIRVMRQMMRPMMRTNRGSQVSSPIGRPRRRKRHHRRSRGSSLSRGGFIKLAHWCAGQGAGMASSLLRGFMTVAVRGS